MIRATSYYGHREQLPMGDYPAMLTDSQMEKVMDYAIDENRDMMDCERCGVSYVATVPEVKLELNHPFYGGFICIPCRSYKGKLSHGGR